MPKQAKRPIVLAATTSTASKARDGHRRLCRSAHPSKLTDD